jgi:hypothetical protein
MFRRWAARRKVKQALRGILIINQIMVDHNWPREKMKKWWRDFIKSPGFRKTAVAILMKEFKTNDRNKSTR